MNYVLTSDHLPRSVRVQPTGSFRVTSRPSTLTVLPPDIAMYLYRQDGLIEADVDVLKVRPGRFQKGVSLQVVFMSRQSKQTASAPMRYIGLLFQKELVLMCSRVGMREMKL